MSLILVFTATKMEGALVERLMRNKAHSEGAKARATGTIGDNQIILATTGMGPHNAEAAALGVLNSPGSSNKELPDMLPTPDAALMTGLAGSLVPWLAEGDIVIYENCLTATDERTSIPCSPDLMESMTRSLGSRGLQFKSVIGISSPRIAQHDRERERLAGSGAAVVDMESYHVASCLAAARVPVAVMRAISDSPGSRMPDLNRALTPAGDFDRWALARVLLGSPLATARLFSASRRATAALEQALDAVLSSASFLGGPVQVLAGHDVHEGPEGLSPLASQPTNVPTCQGPLQQVQK